MPSIFERYRARLRNLRHHWGNANCTDLREMSHLTGYRRIPWLSLLRASWQHGASFGDFFEFGFGRMGSAERRCWITRSLRYEITRQLNDSHAARNYSDKLLFARHFERWLGRRVWSWEEIVAMPSSMSLGETVIKPRWGGSSVGILFPGQPMSAAELVTWMQARCNDPAGFIVEEMFQQHPEMARLHPRSVNTVRVVTVVTEQGAVGQLGPACLKIGLGSRVDNVCAGGMVAALDEDGVICRPATTKFRHGLTHTRHPLSGIELLGFRVPFYHEMIKLLADAAVHVPGVRAIGWDVAMGPSGPCLIEGNPAWAQRLPQLPAGKGLRQVAQSYVDTTLVYD